MRILLRTKINTVGREVNKDSVAPVDGENERRGIHLRIGPIRKVPTVQNFFQLDVILWASTDDCPSGGTVHPLVVAM